MVTENDIWGKNQVIHAETHRFSSRCRCANGHPFTAQIHASINIKTDKPVFDRLASTGTMIVQCPTCKADCRVAEPVTLHDPDKQQFALFIPETLTHRELHFRAALLTRIAQSDADHVPPYFGDFQTLIGLPDLIEWRSASSSPQLKRPSYAYDGRPSPHPTTQPSLSPRQSSAAGDTNNPPIHDAFADLNRSDAEAPSYPPPFSMDQDSDEGGDWLDDAALARAGRKSDNAAKPPLPNFDDVEEKKVVDTNSNTSYPAEQNLQRDTNRDMKRRNKKN